MLRKLLVLTILLLIISTTFIKNHTKKLDEEIFSVKENINYLRSAEELVQLEYDYLSSPEKLIELNNLYFGNDLSFSSSENIKIINNVNQVNIKKLIENE
tara:strand:+ start:142 stop:441 length:300 start_codon:yes stop_codon:yes gene_type:complete